MMSSDAIRIIAGVLAVVVLAVIVWRRSRKAGD
jgi:hypothetical protein